MKSVNYHVDLPYPVVSGLKPNKKQAMLLMEGYCGITSELSTVAQYAYHRLKCEKNYAELATVLQGIFLVETHHMALLGNCVNQLGVDPRYYMHLGQKNICWQADVINYKNTVKEMIFADIEGEKGATSYYLQTAKTIGNEKIEPLLLRLAKDEELHMKIFSDLYNKYFMR